MNDEPDRHPPAAAAILAETEAIGFTMASEPKTGSLLRTLAATKPGGRLLELGTGTGYATAWLLEGIDAASRLTSVESEARFQAIAQKHLGGDPRVRFIHDDAAEFLSAVDPASFDFIFADTWAGKLTHLDEALALLKPGGLYVVDDMLPVPGWPAEHARKIGRLLEDLRTRTGLVVTRVSWATGIVIAAKAKSGS